MYLINEIYPSIQGEGVNAGEPVVIVRFSGCNLSCSYCDTDHKQANEMTALGIVQAVRSFNIGRVLLTGGEPLLQVDMPLIRALDFASIYIETNGTIPFPWRSEIDWLTVSPKVPLEVLAKNFSWIDEVRWPIKKGDPLPPRFASAGVHCLSPIFDGNKLNEENLLYAMWLVKKNPEWRLSCQLHKLLNVR